MIHVELQFWTYSSLSNLLDLASVSADGAKLPEFVVLLSVIFLLLLFANTLLLLILLVVFFLESLGFLIEFILMSEVSLQPTGKSVRQTGKQARDISSFAIELA